MLIWRWLNECLWVVGVKLGCSKLGDIVYVYSSVGIATHCICVFFIVYVYVYSSLYMYMCILRCICICVLFVVYVYVYSSLYMYMCILQLGLQHMASTIAAIYVMPGCVLGIGWRLQGTFVLWQGRVNGRCGSLLLHDSTRRVRWSRASVDTRLVPVLPAKHRYNITLLLYYYYPPNIVMIYYYYYTIITRQTSL